MNEYDAIKAKAAYCIMQARKRYGPRWTLAIEEDALRLFRDVPYWVFEKVSEFDQWLMCCDIAVSGGER
jgi:hypothetical protein